MSRLYDNTREPAKTDKRPKQVVALNAVEKPLLFKMLNKTAVSAIIVITLSAISVVLIPISSTLSLSHSIVERSNPSTYVCPSSFNQSLRATVASQFHWSIASRFSGVKTNASNGIFPCTACGIGRENNIDGSVAISR